MTKPVSPDVQEKHRVLNRIMEQYQKVAEAFVERPTLRRLGNLDAFTVRIERRLTDLYLLDHSDNLKRRIKSYAESLRQVCAKEGALIASIDEGKYRVANDLFGNIRRCLMVASSMNRDPAFSQRNQQAVSVE